MWFLTYTALWLRLVTHFILLLNNHLIARGWTPGEFSIRVGETRSRVSLVRTGKRKPPIGERLERWCDILELEDHSRDDFKIAAYLERMHPFMREYIAKILDRKADL